MRQVLKSPFLTVKVAATEAVAAASSSSSSSAADFFLQSDAGSSDDAEDDVNRPTIDIEGLFDRFQRPKKEISIRTETIAEEENRPDIRPSSVIKYEKYLGMTSNEILFAPNFRILINCFHERVWLVDWLLSV